MVRVAEEVRGIGKHELPPLIANIPGNLGHIENLTRALPEYVILFVGAGLSHPFNVPLWLPLLEEIASTGSNGLWGEVYTPGEPDLSLVASRIVGSIGQSSFNSTLKYILRRAKLSPYPKNVAVQLLPRLTFAPVITTNLDHVLEATYARAGRDFSKVVWGERAREVLKTPNWHTRLLIKFHGDCEDESSYIITAEQYDAAYGPVGQPLNLRPKTTALPAAALLAAILRPETSRSLLFLGCSLQQDRTLDVLRHLASRRPGGATHWALLEQPPDPDVQKDRWRFLDQYRIVPIWYPPGRHDVVGDFLDYLHRRQNRVTRWRRQT